MNDLSKGYIKFFNIEPTEKTKLHGTLELKRVSSDGFVILINGQERYGGIVFSYADVLEKVEALKGCGLSIVPLSTSKAKPPAKSEPVEQPERVTPHDLSKCGLCLRAFLPTVCDERESRILATRQGSQYPPKRKPYQKRSVTPEKAV